MDVKRLNDLGIAGASISQFTTWLCDYDIIEMPTTYLPDARRFYDIRCHGIGDGFVAVSLSEDKLLLYMIERAGGEDG